MSRLGGLTLTTLLRGLLITIAWLLLQFPTKLTLSVPQAERGQWLLSEVTLHHISITLLLLSSRTGIEISCQY